jgi:OmcA/MtrC family decaheme c-type cytochrome
VDGAFAWTWARALVGAAAACCLLAAGGCRRPVVGPRAEAQAATGPSLEITAASLDEAGHVVVSLRIADAGAPIATAEEALALAPAFTLAALSPHPVDGLAAWRSLVPTGAQTVAQLPPGGPGTPPEQVLAAVRQPGADTEGALEGDDGTFTYRFAKPPLGADGLPATLDPAETLRVGAWLVGAGTAEAASTFDFRPDGVEPAPRDTVLDANCERCHDAVTSHDGTAGVRLCTTCHTWQAADPDTVDPAAMGGETPATSPNPLELGRLVHRIHRGNELPTLYRSSSAAAAPTLPSTAALPAPFFPGRNPAVSGRKFSVVGAFGREAIYGRTGPRVENGLSTADFQPSYLLFPAAEGVVYPRDLRDCAVCHEGAPQEDEVSSAVSRRTCHGCHPETWFEPSSISDPVHFAHPGGPLTDDGECQGCHVAATATQPKLYAPIAEIHVPPPHSPRFNRPVVEIVSVENLRPGLAPVVRFKLWDTCGGAAAQPISPIGAPELAACAPGGSPVPRGLAGSSRWFVLTVVGPTAPAFGPAWLLSEHPGNPDPFALAADENGVFTYAFASKVPDDASGTWIVAAEARRGVSTPRYAPYVEGDPATDRFLWPYTGETLYETPLNPVVHVDTATGSYGGAGPAGNPVPRRRVVAQEKCDACHDPIEVHGRVRMRVELCVGCHSPERTDRSMRPQVGGRVNLAATFDGIEERSLDFKVLIHRIHSGGRTGAASLEGILPLVHYGRWGTVWFFDGRRFPGDLADCTLCHEGKSYTIEALPADAPPTRVNETGTILHDPGSDAHPADEPAIPPVQAACLGCHTSGATQEHARRNTLAGVERCAGCHVRGALSVDVAHGLAAPGSLDVAATWSSIAERILVPRCASAACHGSPPVAFPRLDAAAWREVVDVPSQQASGLALVKPWAPEESYLLLKARGDGGTAGGLSTPMPAGDAPLSASELAAIEAWIANGAPND